MGLHFVPTPHIDIPYHLPQSWRGSAGLLHPDKQDEFCHRSKIDNNYIQLSTNLVLRGLLVPWQVFIVPGGVPPGRQRLLPRYRGLHSVLP